MKLVSMCCCAPVCLLVDLLIICRVIALHPVKTVVSQIVPLKVLELKSTNFIAILISM
jgi:hypothetical protein